MKKVFFAISFLAVVLSASAQQVDYSVPSVPEESGLGLMPISSENDYVCLPMVKRDQRFVGWVSNNILSISPDGTSIAFLSLRDGKSNIFIKDLAHRVGSVKRTNRNLIQDVSYSRDGKSLCFSELVGTNSNIYVTDANSGFVCRQISSGSKDYSPSYSYDGKFIFFSRTESNVYGIWSYDLDNKYLSSYSTGINPEPSKDNKSFYCVRVNEAGRGEIYRINYQEGVEECIVSDVDRNFTSPHLSPDGNWLLFAGSSKLQSDNFVYWNVDVFVCRTDGSEFMQLTHHAADDLSPVWDASGKYIYFVSQRGSASGTANIWRMNFNL